MDLRLLTKLKSSDTVSLILTVSDVPEILNYYIISSTVGFSIVCSGTCSGSLDNDFAYFNIRLASITNLIDKGYKLTIRYEKEQLHFITEDESIEITPLYVEYRDPSATRLIEKYQRFTSSYNSRIDSESQIDKLEMELKVKKSEYNGISMMNLSGGPPSNPFTGNTVQDKIDEDYLPQIKDLEGKLLQLRKQSTGLRELDLKDFLIIANIAGRTHEIVDFCGEYAITSIGDAFVLQKGISPVMSIQGSLLNLLLNYGGGTEFFVFEDELVYQIGTRDRTTVFISKYLPNNQVDSSIVTRGVVEEKYKINLRNVLNLTTVVRGKFPEFKMDMGNSRFILSNSNGEQIKMKFDVEDAKTLQLNKIMRGVQVQNGISMAVIDIPRGVQQILSFFKNDLVVYVKKNKIIFQSGTLYLVFNR